jgi:hypothetical protein
MSRAELPGGRDDAGTMPLTRDSVPQRLTEAVRGAQLDAATKQQR